MKKKQSVAVYVVTYNREKYLKESITSIINQTYSDFDLYVLDNCSTDNTMDLVSSIDDSRIHYIRHEKNIGGIENIRYAIDSCSADYFVVFHDDDIMLPQFLQKEIELLDNNKDVVAVGGNAEIFGSWSTPALFKNLDHNMFFCKGDFISRYLKTGETLIFPSVMYRNEFIKRNNITIKKEPGPCADLVFLADIEYAGGVLCQIPDVIMRYRVHEGQDTTCNFYSMHIKLYSYLSTNEKYNEAFNNKKRHNRNRYNHFCRQLFFDWFHRKVSKEQATEYYKELAAAININGINSWRLLFMIAANSSIANKMIQNLANLHSSIKKNH